MTLLTVIPHTEECHMVVHILDKTSSGGHKFKVRWELRTARCIIRYSNNKTLSGGHKFKVRLACKEAVLYQVLHPGTCWS
jgi:hypothetical protein